MTFPVVPFASGTKLTAATLNAALSIERVAEAAADQTVTGSTTLVNSTYLVLPLEANSVYVMDTLIIYDAPAAADIKFDWTVPSGAFLRKGYWTSSASATTTDATIFHQADDLLTGNAGAIAAGTFMTARPSGAVATGSAAGNLQFRFAQLASSGSTVLKAGTWMRLTKVA